MGYKPLKLWFDEDLCRLLSAKILIIYPDFQSRDFLRIVSSKIEPLELKDRVEVFSDILYNLFDSNFENGVEILLKILGPENVNETGMFKEFYWVMPIAKFVEKYGLEHLDVSIKAMEEITKRNTSEYTIRPFLKKYPKKMIDQMMIWAESENTHLRRLASEGGRPRLPWASKLDQFIEDPTPLLPILRKLKDDSSKYVQKSVANCLNDILKDNPEIAKTEIESWIPANSTERKWIIKHALRNFRKIEDSWAISILDRLA